MILILLSVVFSICVVIGVVKLLLCLTGDIVLEMFFFFKQKTAYEI